ncbi:hypothetical protein FNJ88_08535 [Chryseobacterium sp. SNU WT5]|uniref:hypothetical protein n=1 Tax=Chryseobacterium sp. SNU WT5 TaxID=2594269 RepID=UPI00117CDD3F|nr:hypothetical protein [Chryseobacterium sp. SNU WT5]QDP85607.1 hypothetical protein FNJ88_08535 [Chryseobacterium sp. SNU WT5]
MKTKLLTLILLLGVSFLFGQKKYVIGNVKNEAQDNIPQTYIYNPRTEEIVVTDKSGDFIISVIPSDELRIVKAGFERLTLRITEDSYSKPMQLTLSKLPFDIEEVTIAFNPTGNLKKDLAYFKTSAKKEKLNTEMNKYMRGPLTEMVPQNNIPSMFVIKKPGDGQISLLTIGSDGSGGIFGLIGSAIIGKKNKPTPPNHAEVEDFYRRVKEVVNLGYFKSYGISEYDFDIFLAYADQTHSLSKKYFRNFNKSAIETELKVALIEYLKTHKVNS